jgi:thymidylate kinase
MTAGGTLLSGLVNMPKTGTLLVFEGPDGVGKSTLVKEAEYILKLRGVRFDSLSFPGKDPGTLGWVVDQIHHTPKAFDICRLTPLSLQALHIAAHLDHIESRILPVLAQGAWFILDRFWWSTWVYGTVERVTAGVLDKLIEAERAAWRETVPGVAFLIGRTSAFHPEQTDAKFLELVKLYNDVALQAKKRHRVISLSNEDLPTSVNTIRAEIEILAAS